MVAFAKLIVEEDTQKSRETRKGPSSTPIYHLPLVQNDVRKVICTCKWHHYPPSTCANILCKQLLYVCQTVCPDILTGLNNYHKLLIIGPFEQTSSLSPYCVNALYQASSGHAFSKVVV